MNNKISQGAIAWAEVIESLAEISAITEDLSRPEDPSLIDEACLHGLMLIGQGYALNMISTPERPRWVANFHWPSSSLGNCPDTTYYFTPIDAGGSYRIWGRRNSIHMVDFQIGEAFYGTEKGGTNKALASYDMRDIPLAADGTFDFVLSAQRPEGWSGSWYPMPATAETITVRQVAYDWLGETEAELHIERLDRPNIGRPSPDALRARVRAIAAYPRLMARFPFGTKLHPGVRARELVNGGVNMMTFGEAGGLADQYYFVGAFDLGPEEALIVETDVPAPCRYWNIQLSDEFNAALDYIDRQSSLNGHQAGVDQDNVFRAVIAHKDPGVANWLDTGGVQSGLFMGRWKEAAAEPSLPRVSKVSLEALPSILPPETQRVNLEERSAIVAARRAAMLDRLGY